MSLANESYTMVERELRNIESSFNRVINQIDKSCIDIEIKERMLEELRESAFEIHHLVPVKKLF